MERLEIRSVQHADTDRLLPLMAAYWASDAIAGFEELTAELSQGRGQPGGRRTKVNEVFEPLRERRRPNGVG